MTTLTQRHCQNCQILASLYTHIRLHQSGAWEGFPLQRKRGGHIPHYTWERLSYGELPTRAVQRGPISPLVPQPSMQSSLSKGLHALAESQPVSREREGRA